MKGTCMLVHQVRPQAWPGSEVRIIFLGCPSLSFHLMLSFPYLPPSSNFSFHPMLSFSYLPPFSTLSFHPKLSFPYVTPNHPHLPVSCNVLLYLPFPPSLQTSPLNTRAWSLPPHSLYLFLSHQKHVSTQPLLPSQTPDPLTHLKHYPKAHHQSRTPIKQAFRRHSPIQPPLTINSPSTSPISSHSPFPSIHPFNLCPHPATPSKTASQPL